MFSNSKLFVRCKCWNGLERCVCFSWSFPNLRTCVFHNLFLVLWRYFFAYFSWCSFEFDCPLELWSWLVVVPLKLWTWMVVIFLELQTLVDTPLELGCWLVVAPLELWSWSIITPLKLWTWMDVVPFELRTSATIPLELGCWSTNTPLALGTLVVFHGTIGTLISILLKKSINYYSSWAWNLINCWFSSIWNLINCHTSCAWNLITYYFSWTSILSYNFGVFSDLVHIMLWRIKPSLLLFFFPSQFLTIFCHHCLFHWTIDLTPLPTPFNFNCLFEFATGMMQWPFFVTIKP